jgi:hypothetical protein
MTHDEMIEVIQAHKDGKVIQLRGLQRDWIDVPRTPDWDFPNIIYRVKPEPKEYWLVPYAGKLGFMVLDTDPKDLEPKFYAGDLVISRVVHVVTVEELTND